MAISTIKNWVQKLNTGTYKSSWKIDSDGASPCTLANDSGALSTATVKATTALDIGSTPVELTDNSGALACDADVFELGTTPISLTDNSGNLAIDADNLELGSTPITLTDDSGDLAIDADVVKLGSTAVSIKSDSGVLMITNDGGVETPALASKMAFTGTYSMSADVSDVTLMQFVCPYDGYLVASAILMSDARTAGSIAFTIEKNGTPLTPTGLSHAIDDDPTTKSSKTVDYGTTDYDVAAGDVISIVATSSSFTPATNTISMTLVVEG